MNMPDTSSCHHLFDVSVDLAQSLLTALVALSSISMGGFLHQRPDDGQALALAAGEPGP